MSNKDEAKTKKFVDWLRAAYLDWQRDTGNLGNISKFAEWIDSSISQPTMSKWINGVTLPTGDNIYRLARKLGNEVYDILGEVPLIEDERLRNIVRGWDGLPEEVKDQMERNALKGKSQNGQTTPNDHKRLGKTKR